MTMMTRSCAKTVVAVAMVLVAVEGFSFSRSRGSIVQRRMAEEVEEVEAAPELPRRSRFIRVREEVEDLETAFDASEHDTERISLLADRVSSLVTGRSAYSPSVQERIVKLAQRAAVVATSTLEAVIAEETGSPKVAIPPEAAVLPKKKKKKPYNKKKKTPLEANATLTPNKQQQKQPQQKKAAPSDELIVSTVAKEGAVNAPKKQQQQEKKEAATMTVSAVAKEGGAVNAALAKLEKQPQQQKKVSLEANATLSKPKKQPQQKKKVEANATLATKQKQPQQQQEKKKKVEANATLSTPPKKKQPQQKKEAATPLEEKPFVVTVGKVGAVDAALLKLRKQQPKVGANATLAPKKKPQPQPKKKVETEATPPVPKKNKPADMKKLRVGDLVDGTCVDVVKYGAFIELDAVTSKRGLLHISEITSGRVDDIATVLPIGTKMRCVVAAIEKGRVSLSTRSLEATPGEMLRDSAGLFKRVANTPYLRPDGRAQLAAETASARKKVETVEAMASSFSLEDLESVLKRAAKKLNPKKRRKKADEENSEANSALSLMSAFMPADKQQEQRKQEFELLMRDVIYEQPSTSLTDITGALLNGRKKRGSFASPFWKKLFPKKMLDQLNEEAGDNEEAFVSKKMLDQMKEAGDDDEEASKEKK